MHYLKYCESFLNSEGFGVEIKHEGADPNNALPMTVKDLRELHTAELIGMQGHITVEKLVALPEYRVHFSMDKLGLLYKGDPHSFHCCSFTYEGGLNKAMVFFDITENLAVRVRGMEGYNSKQAVYPGFMHIVEKPALEVIDHTLEKFIELAK